MKRKRTKFLFFSFFNIFFFISIHFSLDKPIGKAGSASGIIEQALYGFNPFKDKYYIPKLLVER